MDKYKDYILKTEHTSNEVNNDKTKFDDYMFNEKEILVTLLEDLKLKNKTLRVKRLDFNNFKDGIKDVTEKSLELFDRVYKVAGAVDKENLDDYFKGMVPYRVSNIKDIRLALSRALVKIQNIDIEELNHYESKIELELQNINSSLPDYLEAENELDLAKEEYNKAEYDWETQYGKLKSLYKGWFYRKEQDYKDYFLDLGKTKHKSKPKEETSTTSNDSKENKEL